MRIRFITNLLIITFILTVTAGTEYFAGMIKQGTPVEIPPRQYHQTMILLPLDSRPACTQFVKQLADLANIQVIMPPDMYMDNYTQPSDKHALAAWLRNAAKKADAVIVSTDMLLSGSLLASRSNISANEDIESIAALLTDIRRENPSIHLYSFHIIPRLLLADHSPDRHFQKSLQNYSILRDQLLQFENPLDMKKLIKLESEIPTRVISQQQLLYEQNEYAQRTWFRLVKEQIIDAVVVGQDDGYPFGLPNLLKQRLQSTVEHDGLAGKVFITRGTDEVAITLLGHFALANRKSPRIFVEYSAPDAPQVIMPFMPHSVATTVKEKLALIHGQQTGTPDNADFTLFVHIGRRNSTPQSLRAAAQRLKEHLAAGQKIALVDLTEDFYASETLLPYLIEADADIAKLTAYAGWNTTSNSIGTAVTQAAIYTDMKKTADEPVQLRLLHDNLVFLTARLLDDWYYLKEIQPQVNEKLRAFGRNPYQLKNSRRSTEALIRREMNARADKLNHLLREKPFAVDGFEQPFLLQTVNIAVSLPWDRTFEIKIEPAISLTNITPY